jgi:predicted aconitase with swiveling domain
LKTIINQTDNGSGITFAFELGPAKRKWIESPHMVEGENLNGGVRVVKRGRGNAKAWNSGSSVADYDVCMQPACGSGGS